MKFAASEVGEVDTYRISRSADRWRRTWQAEWINLSTGDYCPRAPRAWTQAGILRKASRWYRRQNRGF